MAEKEKKQNVSIVKKEKAENQSVESFISQAINQGLPVETMERLFSLRKEVKAEIAREAFTAALSEFQSACPVIEKTKKVLNKDGQSVRYMFAPIDSIVKQIQKPLGEAQLAYTWEVKNTPGFITAVCTITHALGHKESSEFMIPIDTEGYMSAPQKYASSLTFAKRYSLCNALGISTGDEDTDATDVNKEKDAKSNKSKIIFLLKKLGKPTEKKEEIEFAVMDLAKLSLEDKNLSEIVGRLEIIVKEKQEYDNENPKVQ